MDKGHALPTVCLPYSYPKGNAPLTARIPNVSYSINSLMVYCIAIVIFSNTL